MKAASGDTVVSGDGRQLRLGELIKSGGAGSVYRLRDAPESVAKIYHDDADRPTYERKVAAMLELSPQLPEIASGSERFVQIAWPSSLLRDGRGRFQGFLMPAVDVAATAELELIMQERQARAAGLPTGLGAKATLAANLAAVMAELHRQQHRIVDLKPVNLRFYPRSLYMAMLDCDGFSIQGHGERFPAPQFTVDYLAPEFQAGGITVAGEEQQDRFALAVVIFQLLNFGIHPFTGRPQSERVPTDVPGRIAARLYAYGLQANAKLLPSPVSGHQALPADIRALLDRAFDGPALARPAPAEWATLLRAYAQRSASRLVVCTRDDEHQHFAGLPCAACARAELLQRTARAAGTVPRPPPAPPSPSTPARKGKAARGKKYQPAATRNAPIPKRAPPFSRRAPAVRVPLSQGVGAWVQNKISTSRSDMAWFALFFVIFVVITAWNDRDREPVVEDTRDWSATPPSQVPNWMRSQQPTPAPTMTPDESILALADEDAQVLHLAVESIAQAMAAGHRDQALNELASLRARNAGQDSGPLVMGSDDARFLRFAREHLPTKDPNDARRQMTADWVANNPLDAEATCEWGWHAVGSGSRQRALAAFERSLWARPDQVCGWTGVAMLSESPEVSVGALAMAFSISTYSERAETEVNLFVSRTMAGAGISTPWRQERSQAARDLLAAMKQ